jgi:hypothetical protein
VKNLIKIGLLLLVMSVISPIVKGQGFNSSNDYAGSIGPATVTHTNAMADTVSLAIAKSRTAITFKYDIAKTSGTVAGTIVLQGRITATTTAEQWTTINSYTLTDATATNSVSLTANQYLNYRIITTTTGTSVTVHRKWLLCRGY